jgi:trimeric autotransporter adhesin
LKRSRWAALILIAITALLGSCGGGAPAPNPTPSIGTLLPADITAGSALFTLNVGGTGFVQNQTQAFWNGSQRTATLNTGTGQLEVSILASDVAVAGSAQVLLVNPPPGGGPAFSPATFIINPTQNGAPVITGFSPVDTPANTKLPFTLTVNGANFVPTVGTTLGSNIDWNGSFRTTTFVSSTTLTTNDFSSADFGTCGPASITVVNPGPNGGVVNSVSVDFNLTGACNPVPAIVSISPASTTVGVMPPPAMLTITGFDFASSATVSFNGVQQDAVVVVSSTEIAVPLAGADLMEPGLIAVTVTNPTPGGGASAAAIFTINP